MTSESAAIPEGSARRREPEFERRAALALKAVAVFGAVVGIVLIANGSSPRPVPLFLATVLAYCTTAWFAATGIDAGRTWALGAAPILLAAMLVTGVIDFLLAAQQNVLRIPLAAVVAIWALAAPRSAPRLVGRDRRVAGAVVGLFTAASLVLTVGPVLAGPSGPFAAAESDLTLSIDVSCGPAGTYPVTVPVTVRWSWTRGEPFPSGTDAVAIAWYSGAEDGTKELLTVQPDFQTTPGVWSGGGEASSADAQRFVAANGGGLMFGVDLAEQRYRPGSVSITLERSSPTVVEHGALDVRALYSHLGRWRVTSRPMPGCTW